MDKVKLSRMRSLQEKINKLNKEKSPLVEELEDIKDEKRTEELGKYIGKCYKFKNSYSYDKPWWLYLKVVGATPDFVEVIGCEKDIYGKITIKRDTISMETLERRIYEKTFNKMFKKHLDELKK